MSFKRWIFPVVFAAVLLPLFAGFAAEDAAAGRWDRVARNGSRLVRHLLTARASWADDNVAPVAAYRDALQVLKMHYAPKKLTDKDVTELTYAAIRGMLFSLNDPFTSFLDPDEWKTMRQTTSGEFEGIGAVLEPFGQEVRVVRPIPDSPAFKAGVKAKDVVVAVDTYQGGKKVKTTPTLGIGINEVVKLIKGPRGTQVGITVSRKGSPQPITFVITRAHIEPPTVQAWMADEENKIGHILLNEFNEKSDAQFDRAYQALRQRGMRALIFDLRNNPGGLLNVAVDIGSRFVDRGPVVVIQEKGGPEQELANPGKRKVNVPVVVLINEASASASEIVAGAIKDTGRGVLVGQHTFGKGLVQTLFPLNDGGSGDRSSALRLTTAKYLTPKRHDINNKYDDDHRPIFGTGGIKPDIEVKLPEDFDSQDTTDENRAKDPQIKKALEVLRTRLAKSAQRP